jgi:hypothetical protein
MTYRYVLIVGGQQEGEAVASAAEVYSAVQRYLAEHRHRPPAGRLMVGRLVNERDEAVHGRGVFAAEAFEPGAPNASLDQVYWHQRIRDLINARLNTRTHFLWLDIKSGDGDSTIDEDAFLSAVSAWVSQLDEPSAEDRTHTGKDGWGWMGNEFQWNRETLVLKLTALRSRTGGPLTEIVGNPEPAFAFYAND